MRYKNNLAGIIAILISISILTALTGSMRSENSRNITCPAIWTDKEDYAPEETVIIYGSGFSPEAIVSITVMRPDGYAEEWTVMSNSNGSFTTTYLLDGIEGVYSVTATDGMNTASTTFTDTPGGGGQQLNIAWVKSSDSTGREKNTFSTDEDVYVVIKTSGSGSITVRIYVVNDPATHGPLTDVGDGYETVTLSGSGEHGPFLIWKAPLKEGKYDIVVDENQNGEYDPGEKIDSSKGIGFTVTVAPFASISIKKTANVTMAHVGDVIEYSYNIANIGNVDLNGIYVYDNVTGKVDVGDLEPGEWIVVTATHTVKDTDPDPLVNNATVYAYYSNIEVCAWDTWTVDILRPAIKVTKSGPEYAHEGDEISYTITVRNIGDCPLSSVEVYDDVLGSIYTGELDVGEEKTFTMPYTVPSPSGDITNTVMASGKDALGLTVTDTASWTVDVLHPDIAIEKSADKDEAYAGDTITYTITVANVGDCTLYNVNVTDTLLGDICIGTLNVGESATFTLNYTVKVGDPDPLENTATVSGKDILGKVVTATDTATVNLIAAMHTITFYIYDDAGGVVSGATINFAGSSFSHNGSTSVTADSYSLSTGTIPSGYRFKQWEASGGVSIASSTSPSTTATVSESGSITMRLQRVATVTFSVIEVGSDASGTVLTVDGVNYTYGQLPVSFTWDVGSSHSFTWADPVSSSTSSKRYIWASTIGLSTARSGTITVPPGGGSVNATYKIQYQWTFSVSGLSSDASGTVVTIDGTNYAYSSLPVSFWWDSGSTHSYTYQQYVSTTASGKRYANHSPPSWSGQITSSGSVNPVYHAEYQLIVSVSPSGAGSISLNPSSPDGYYDDGTIVTATASANVGYTFSKWQLDGSDYSTSNPTNVTMDMPHTLTAVFTGATYQLTVYVYRSGTTTGIEGVTVKVDGTSYSTDLNGSVQVTVSYGSHTVEVMSPYSPSSGTQYVFTQWGDGSTSNPRSITVTGDTALTAYMKLQYYLTMQVSPSGGGSVSPSSGWYDAGSSVTISATPSSGWAFERWVGSGSGSYSGTSSSASITMNAPITETAYFYTFSVSVSPSSGSVQQGGSASATVNVTLTGGYSASISVSLSASGLPSGASASFSPSSVTISPSSPTAQSTMTITTSPTTPTGTYSITITGSGDGLSKTTTYTLTVNAATYTVNFYVYDDANNVISGATLNFAGQSYSHGQSASVAAGTRSLSTGTIPSGYRFKQWEASGGVSIASPSSSSTTATVSGAGSIIMRLQRVATVTFSANGLSWDASGTVLTVDGVGYAYSQLPISFTWDVGSSHSFSWADPVGAGSGKRYVWASTSGLSTYKSGSIIVPAGGGSVSATYETQYYLTVISPYGTPSGEGWYDDGEIAYARLATGIVNLTSGMRAVFTGWSGDASGTDLISDPIIMDSPKIAVANWIIQWLINVEVIPEEAGLTPGGGWYTNCSTVTLEAPEYLPSEEGMNGVRYRFDYWEVDGERFKDSRISVHANTSHTITSNYIIQYRVIFSQAGLDQSTNEVVLTVNGSAKRFEDLPFIMWVDYNSLINYAYKGNVSSSINGKQFRLENVTGPVSPLRVTGPVNVTGNYQTLYYLSVISQYGNPYGSGWYPFNSEAKFGVTTPIDHGNRTLRVFLEWYGDVSIFEPEGTILMTKPSVVIASWETRYLVTFNTTLPNKYVLHVPGVPENLPPGMDVFGMYYPAGERVTVGPAPIIVPGYEGIRYVFIGWILDNEIATYDVNMSFVVKKPHDVRALYDTEYLLSVNAAGVSDPFTSIITISFGTSITRELTPTSQIQEWFKQGTNLALTASTPNKIGHGEWAIFKEWTGDLKAINRTILLVMLSPIKLNAVFFKVNPVAESIPYSIVAGLISMLLCAISARRRSSNSKRRRPVTSGIIVSAVALIVAAIVSIIIATGYGININELPDFTNWAVIFLIFEAIIFALVTAVIVRKVQRQ